MKVLDWPQRFDTAMERHFEARMILPAQKRAQTLRLVSGGARRDRSLNPIVQQLRDRLIALAAEHSNRADKASSAGFSDQAKRAMYAAYLAAMQAGFDDSGADASEWDPLTAESAASEATDAQGGFLDRLAALLIGGLLTAAAIDGRMGQYAATANPVYEQGFANGVNAQGQVTTATWHTTGDGEVCQLCDERDGTVWYGDEPHPYPGEGYYGDVCEGGPNCRCEIWYDIIPADTVDAEPEDIAATATADLLKMRADLLKYSDDEPRDEHGRWVGAGDDYMAPDQAERAVRTLYPNAKTGGFHTFNRLLVNQAVHTLRQLHDKYPGIRVDAFVGTRSGLGSGRHVMAIAVDGTQIGLNEKFWASGAVMARQADGEFHAPSPMSPAEATIAHEFGHLVDAQYFGGHGATSGMPIVSGYAGVGGPSEAFAEAFVQHAAGMDTPGAQWMAERLASIGKAERPDLLKYSPDQPRDEDGRFAGGGDSESPKLWGAAVYSWTQATGARAIRQALAKGEDRPYFLSGTERTTILTVGRAMVDRVNAAAATSYALYRGIRVSQEDYPAFQAAFVEGKTVDMNLSSWTPKEDVAGDFAAGLWGTAGGGQDANAVVFALDAGAHALSIQDEAPASQKFAEEHLTLGRFAVTSIEHTELESASNRIFGSKPQSIDYITLKQVGTLGPDQLVGTKVARAEGPAHFLDWLEPYLDARMVPPLEYSVGKLSTAQLLALKYSDDEPRDEHGRWTGDGAEPGNANDATVPGRRYGWPGPVLPEGYLYHGTRAAYLPDIRQNGLRPRGAAGVFFARPNEPDGAIDHAYTFEDQAKPGDRLSGQGVLLRVPHDAVTNQLDQFGMASAAHQTMGDVTTRDTIPPEKIEMWGADGAWHPLATVKYSEDEPRDEHGRWAAGEGGLNAAMDAYREKYPDHEPAALRGLTPEQKALLRDMLPAIERTIGPGFENADPELGARALEQLDKLQQQFPEANLRSVNVTDLRSGWGAEVTAATVALEVMGTIHLSKDYFGADGIYRDELTKPSGGFHPPGTETPEGYVTHEFGHTVLETLGQMYKSAPERMGPWMSWRMAASAEYSATKPLSMRPDSSLKFISGYGRTGGFREAFAETFAAAYAPGSRSEHPAAAGLRLVLQQIGFDTSSGSVRKYSDDQPRDEHGRWTAGGDGAQAIAEPLTSPVWGHFAPADHSAENEAVANAFEAATGTRIDATLRAAADPQVMQQVTEQMAAMQERFSSVHVDLLTAADLGFNVQAQYESDGANRVITLDREWADTPDTRETPGWHPPGVGASWTGLVTHEFGHAVDDYLAMGDRLQSMWQSTDDQPVKIESPYSKFMDKMAGWAPVSGYGAVGGPAENFAELFAAAYATPHQQDVATAGQSYELRRMLADSFPLDHP